MRLALVGNEPDGAALGVYRLDPVADPGARSALLEAFRANTVDVASVYVAISRARKHAAVYTDSRAKLVDAIGARDGAQIGALDEVLTRYGPCAALDGPGPDSNSSCFLVTL